MSLVPARGSAPLNVGVVLMIDVGDGLDTTRLLETIADRLPAVPRLRQRLIRVPFGCGRPVWVDDPEFRIEAHLAAVPCQGPCSVDAVLQIAAELLTVPLPRDRPLWAARLVTTTGSPLAALIVVFHHVVADGEGGLAVLGRLVDGAEHSQTRASPARHPLAPGSVSTQRPDTPGPCPACRR